MVEIHYETSEDRASVRHVHQQAFGQSDEADLVERLHTTADRAPIALVATLHGQVVGHILFSPVVLDPVRPHFKAV